jgi:hypothetical protein
MCYFPSKYKLFLGISYSSGSSFLGSTVDLKGEGKEQLPGSTVDLQVEVPDIASMPKRKLVITQFAFKLKRFYLCLSLLFYPLFDLYVCLSLCLSVCLTVCLPVCLSV